MKRKFIGVLSVVVFSLFAQYGYGQCEGKIKDFYVAYMLNAENDDAANVELLKANMTPELIAKLRDYAEQHDVDAVINAQDVCKYGRQSLVVVPDKDDRYIVKYKWSPESDFTCIMVRATDTDGKFEIYDLSPCDAESTTWR